MKILGTVVVMAALSMGLLALPASAEVTINIGAPPPPIVIASPPKVVVVPGTPVYYATSLFPGDRYEVELRQTRPESGRP